MPSTAEGVIPQQTCCHRSCTASWGCTVHGSPMHAHLQAVPRQPPPHRAPARSCYPVNEISQLLLSSTLFALQPPLQRLSPWLAMYLMPFLCLASAFIVTHITTPATWEALAAACCVSLCYHRVALLQAYCWLPASPAEVHIKGFCSVVVVV